MQATKVLAIAGRDIKHSAGNIYSASVPAGRYNLAVNLIFGKRTIISFGIGRRNSEALPSPILNRWASLWVFAFFIVSGLDSTI